MGRRHGAVVIVTMGEAQGMPQLVHRFHQKTVGQQVHIFRQPVEFLLQTMIGNNS